MAKGRVITDDRVVHAMGSRPGFTSLCQGDFRASVTSESPESEVPVTCMWCVVDLSSFLLWGCDSRSTIYNYCMNDDAPAVTMIHEEVTVR